MAGDDFDFAAFDFTDGRYHHVAFVILGDLTDVYIDGNYSDSLAIGIDTSVPLASFHIGSFNGLGGYFQGEIGGVRLWNLPLEPDNLEDARFTPFSTKGDDDHPEKDALIGYSDFSNDGARFILADSPQPDFSIVTLPLTLRVVFGGFLGFVRCS